MRDRKSNESRRKLLKSIAAGSGAVVAGKSLPESWSKPIVDSVMLPAHAATTIVSISYWGLNVQATGVGYIEPNKNGIHACIVVTGDMADITFQGGANKGRRRGTVPLDGTRGDAVSVASAPDCKGPVPTKQIFVIEHSPDSVTFGVRGSNDKADTGFDVTIFKGTCGSFPALDGIC